MGVDTARDITVFKKTTSDWYPNYQGGYVRVSLVRCRPDGTYWRVCAWGEDDFGMERDYVGDAFNSYFQAFHLFMDVIRMEDVTIDSLTSMGFKGA